MPVTLPIEIYEAFESSLGKENAHKVVKSLEAAISDATEFKWKVTKDELLEAIRKEFITRELFEEKINTLRAAMVAIEDKMDAQKSSLEDKMDAQKSSLEDKMDAQKSSLEDKMDAQKSALEGRMDSLEDKMDAQKSAIEGRMDTQKAYLEGKINALEANLTGQLNSLKTYVDGKFDSINQKFTFMIILLIIALTLMNPVAAELIKHLLKL